ncbi:hypothetical protein AJ87_11525 [Rhizobium yanglingense]|nr:hypothetical protein AJ87_11525 [Rhizobium yanglingense]
MKLLILRAEMSRIGSDCAPSGLPDLVKLHPPHLDHSKSLQTDRPGVPPAALSVPLCNFYVAWNKEMTTSAIGKPLRGQVWDRRK